MPETVWDNRDLLSGSYEDIGELSGMRWDKYLLLPVYWIEEVSTAFDASEVGYIKENTTTAIIPSSYGIQPFPHDIIKFDQNFLMPDNNVYPIFEVGGVEKSVNTPITMWKLKLETKQSLTTEAVDEQTNEVVEEATDEIEEQEEKEEAVEDEAEAIAEESSEAEETEEE